MPELLLAIVDDAHDTLLVDATNPITAGLIVDDLGEQIGQYQPAVCARPADPILRLPESYDPLAPTIRIGGYWHDSLIEGPGRRSVVRMQGCPIRCPGCIVPQTWDRDSGTLASIGAVADALLDSAYERDGVTILGGEPFAQPMALASLIASLRRRDPYLHVLVYSGFTLEHLQQMGTHDVYVRYVLGEIDMLIDGPYVKALASGAGPWTGSSNQRVLDRVGSEWRPA